MIQIPLGNVFIETDVISKQDLESLEANPSNPALIKLLRDQASQSITRMRERIEDADLNSAIAEQATAKTYEELAVMLESGVTQALNSK